jgi:hypothetical protein
MEKRQDQNQKKEKDFNLSGKAVQEKRQSPAKQMRQGNAIDLEKEKKQAQEAPSREDWEGGASRPEAEHQQRVKPPGAERGGSTRRRNPEQSPKAGGTGEATEDENKFEEGSRYGEQAA